MVYAMVMKGTGDEPFQVCKLAENHCPLLAGVCQNASENFCYVRNLAAMLQLLIFKVLRQSSCLGKLAHVHCVSFGVDRTPTQGTRSCPALDQLLMAVLAIHVATAQHNASQCCVEAVLANRAFLRLPQDRVALAHEAFPQLLQETEGSSCMLPVAMSTCQDSPLHLCWTQFHHISRGLSGFAPGQTGLVASSSGPKLFAERLGDLTAELQLLELCCEKV
mmetsp:Transcript_103701/g.184239  ORF Transcript_103701/g.184239 Transcript_103701/m.184239 type:complete len:220 (+) Transcript_103701:783-1442(+)